MTQYLGPKVDNLDLATKGDITGGGGGMSLLDSQTFTSSTTYTPNAAAKLIVVECIGAGGGGSGGSRNTGTSSATGGTGGTGGMWFRETLIAGTDFTAGSSQTVTIGLGGTGGAGRTGSTGTGSDGSNGGDSRFGNTYWLGGRGSSVSTPGFVIDGRFSIDANGARGVGRGSVAHSSGIRSFRGGGGGGGGGSSSTTASNGSAGGSTSTNPSDVFQAAPGNNLSAGGGGVGGTPGTPNGSDGGTAGFGGGGGRGSITAGVAAGNGGNGAAPGGGGGGGGAGSNDQNGGTGGNGGRAEMKIWVYG